MLLPGRRRKSTFDVCRIRNTEAEDQKEMFDRTYAESVIEGSLARPKTWIGQYEHYCSEQWGLSVCSWLQPGIRVATASDHRSGGNLRTV